MSLAKPTRAVSTKMLSARVTPDVYNAWQTLAKSEGKSVSECLRDSVVMVDKKGILKAQDGMIVPDELTGVLASIGGGSLVGILLYKGIRATLEQKYNGKMKQNEIESVSITLALSGAVLIVMKKSFPFQEKQV